MTRYKKDERFLLSTSDRRFRLRSRSSSQPAASRFPKWARRISATESRGSSVFALTETRPALVPLTLDGDEGRALRDLSGVSFDANVRCSSAAFRENVLFTHRGLSGPAILQISSYWKPGDPIVIEPRSPPRRFVQKWRELYEDAPMDNWKLTPSGTEGYAKAEVTLGGVDTDELSSKTMEARRVPGLYFIGEVVDVTGHLGGFNFQWAWASGFVAGQYA